MKALKHLVFIGLIVFITCSPALSKIDVQQYLNSVGNVNQAAIEAAIAGGADPISLAAELAAAKPELASAFALAIATAAPNVDLAALMAAVIKAAPNQADQITSTMQAAFPNAFQAVNNFANSNQNTSQGLQNQDTQAQQYQTQKRNVPSPSS